MVKNEGEDWKAYSSLGQQIVSMIFFHRRKGFLVQFRSGSGDEPEDMSEKLETTALATNPQLPPSFTVRGTNLLLQAIPSCSYSHSA